MGIGWIILIFFSAFIIYILIIPVSLKIDTPENNYYLRMPGVWGIQLCEKKGTWKATFSILFLRFKIPGSGKHREKLKSKHFDKPERLKKRRNKTRLMKISFRTLKTFKIKRIECNIDTGDFPLNAQLIPVANALSRRKVNLMVNFNGSNYLYLVVYTRLYKIIYQLIRK